VVHAKDNEVRARPTRAKPAVDAAETPPEALALRGPTLVEPGLLYAQQAVPSKGKRSSPAVMDALRKGMTRSSVPTVPAPASTPAQAESPRAKTTVNGEGDGKLRIHIYDEDIRKVLDLLSEQGHFNILASKNVEGKSPPRSTTWISTAHCKRF